MRRIFLALLISVFSLSATAQTEVKTDHYRGGKVKSKTTYVDGKKDGTQTYYNKAGEIVLITPWSNDEKEGIEVYYKNGDVLYEITWADGKKNGVYNWYYKGSLYKQMIFVNNKLDSTIVDIGEVEKQQAIARNKERLQKLDAYFADLEKLDTKAISTSFSTNDGNGVNGTNDRAVERRIINADGSTTTSN